MKYPIAYIVAYQFEGGCGQINVNRTKKVKTLSDFRELEEFIRQQKGNEKLKSLFITNLIELENK